MFLTLLSPSGGWQRLYPRVACRWRPSLGTRHGPVSCKRWVTLLRFCPIYSLPTLHYSLARAAGNGVWGAPSSGHEGGSCVKTISFENKKSGITSAISQQFSGLRRFYFYERIYLTKS